MPTPTTEILAARLATARKIRGLMGEHSMNQTQFGSVISKSQSTASKLLDGINAFSADQLYVIAAHFDVPIGDLFPSPNDRDREEAEIRNRWSSSDPVSRNMAGV